MRTAPGLGLVFLVTTTAYVVAMVPPFSVVGPLILALVIGMLVRRWRRARESEVAGTTFAARTLLRAGVVLLGVRLDLSLLTSVGPAMLLGSLLMVGSALVLVQVIGRRLGLSRGLRVALALGSGVCGASAVLAATAACRISDEDAGIAVGVISFVGTVGALAFAVVAALADPHAVGYGVLVGLTLQEVGQVVAAGYAHGTVAGDAATLAKLTRVAMLAPALVVYSRLPLGTGHAEPLGVGHDGPLGTGHEEPLGTGHDEALGTGRGEAPRTAADDAMPASRSRARSRGFLQRSGVPPFLLGFLLVAGLQSSGAIPQDVSRAMEVGSLLLTAAAMAGLGLGLDLRALRRLGPRALLVGSLAFLGLVLLALPYSVLLAQ